MQSHDFALEWMSDFEEFQARSPRIEGARDAEGEPTYMNSLMNSMSLVLDEFYKNLKVRRSCSFSVVLSQNRFRQLVCQALPVTVSKSF